MNTTETSETRSGLRMVAFLAALASLLLFLSCSVTGSRDGVRAIESGEGWGYELTVGGRRVVYQPSVPAVQGNQPFQSRADALKTGRCALGHLKDTGRPTVSRSDLDRLKIKYELQ